jgi:large subunit ribosomal protein L14
MIQVQSNIHVADNSGARQARCIRILNKSRSKTASVGDLITVSLRQVRPNKRAKKKAIHTALVVRTKKPFLRSNGFKISLGENACILVGSRVDKNPLGTRLTGPVGIHELRKSKCVKCILLSKHEI